MSEPTPPAAPVQATPAPPAQPVPAAQPPVPEDPRDAELARLRAQVQRLEADARASGVPAAPDDVQLKVEEPHAEFHFGNLHLGREFRAVPAALAAAIHNAAHEAGVRLTQKESES